MDNRLNKLLNPDLMIVKIYIVWLQWLRLELVNRFYTGELNMECMVFLLILVQHLLIYLKKFIKIFKIL